MTKPDLVRHLETVRAQHHDGVAVGAGHVELPTALLRKYPSAGQEWAWQWVLPATRIYWHAVEPRVDRLVPAMRSPGPDPVPRVRPQEG